MARTPSSIQLWASSARPRFSNHSMQTIYLARHASPDWNRKDIPYHLPPGPPLTPQGRLEAAALGAFLRTANIRTIASSPLERCHHTARIVGDTLSLPVAIDDTLTEWQPDESSDALGRRMWRIFRDTWEATVDQGHQAALLLTHGGPIMELLRRLGMSDKVIEQHRVYDHRNPVPPAGVWQVSRGHDHTSWELSLVFVPQVA